MKKLQKFEYKLYKKLGAEIFRKKGVFTLEKLIHTRDKGENINYHIKMDSPENAKSFIKYLYYNGVIHFKNSVILTPLLIAKIILFPKYWAITLLLSLLLTKDLYCVMLQRYNYIRINRYNELYEKNKKMRSERQAKEIEKDESLQNVLLSLTDEQKEKDLELAEKLNGFLLNINDIELNDASIESLRRISEFLRIYEQKCDTIPIETSIVEKGGK